MGFGEAHSEITAEMEAMSDLKICDAACGCVQADDDQQRWLMK